MALSTVTAVSWFKIDDREAVRWLILDRPQTKNAIPLDGWAELGAAFGDFEHSDMRVLVVTGSGGEFCSGAELDPARMDKLQTVEDRRERMRLIGSVAMDLHHITKPTLAAVDGVAVGAGMNLALGCDLVIASERARFAEIFVRRGLTLDFGGSWLLPRVVGIQRAKELALTGRIVDAEEARRIGLVLEVVPHEALESRAAEMSESLLAGAPLAQLFAKQTINASYQTGLSDLLSWEGDAQSIALGSEDAAEGIMAFLEKRPPEWRGR